MIDRGPDSESDLGFGSKTSSLTLMGFGFRSEAGFDEMEAWALSFWAWA
jgi:hypothetical protein